MAHGPSGLPTELAQAARKFKVLLDKLTPTKLAEAQIMGVSHSTIAGWCNPSQYNPQMPAAFVPYHSDAETLLSVLAQQAGFELVPLKRDFRRDGDITDEVLLCLRDLGRVSDQLKEAHEDLLTPGRIDEREAQLLLDQARFLEKDVQRMIAELVALVESKNEVPRRQRGPRK